CPATLGFMVSSPSLRRAILLRRILRRNFGSRACFVQRGAASIALLEGYRESYELRAPGSMVLPYQPLSYSGHRLPIFRIPDLFTRHFKCGFIPTSTCATPVRNPQLPADGRSKRSSSP